MSQKNKFNEIIHLLFYFIELFSTHLYCIDSSSAKHLYHVFFTNASRFNAKMKIKPILNPNKQYQSHKK